ncbi:HAMP domain-containing sensor histidine kinase [Blastomonas sp. AAP53]|uniref:sensor histidine kinase n=1 Tax=Blastomonas sp. AAP53 TaxID=1248760 RepID=UPI0002FA4419|nr:HAMP domain-containing sensor histidine kinase [Blastomonas sp. AAP53]
MIFSSHRSIFTRIVVLAIALSVVLVAGLWLLTDRTIRATLDASAREAVDVDLAGLVDIHASGGQQELARRIGDRLMMRPADGSLPHYLLADGAGRRIAGDISTWPALDARVSEGGMIRIGEATDAFARATRLGPDLRLVVAHEAADGRPLLQRVALVFLAGGGVFVLTVGLFGRTAIGQLQRRIASINRAFRDLDARHIRMLAEGRRTDEIDELAGHSAVALARLRDLMKAYRETSDQVAHEIRTPVMHLDRRLAKLLAAKPDADTANALIAARTDIRHLVSTLESLLDIAASRARRGDRIGLKRIDLSALLESICNLYADSSEESGHQFVWTIEPGVHIDGEETQLSRLITNLLDNAFKYVPQGGSVTVTLGAGPVLTVEDDGPGIPEADRARVFDQFYRSDNVAQHQPGSGLGLALARAVAERHGLTLDLVDSTQGASFKLSRETQ